MLQLALPHINVLSKVDLVEKFGLLSFNIDYFCDVLDLSYLLDRINDDPFNKKFKKLNRAMCGIIEDYSLGEGERRRGRRIERRADGNEWKHRMRLGRLGNAHIEKQTVDTTLVAASTEKSSKRQIKFTLSSLVPLLQCPSSR